MNAGVMLPMLPPTFAKLISKIGSEVDCCIYPMGNEAREPVSFGDSDGTRGCNLIGKTDIKDMFYLIGQMAS